VPESLAVPVELSPLDEARFGVRAARAKNLTADLLPHVMNLCNQWKVQFLIARCSTQDLPAVQAMQRRGFLLMDTLVYFRYDLEQMALPQRREVDIRSVRTDDTELIGRIARQAFQGYGGHYHADQRLDRASCNDLYVDWAVRSCTHKELADEVLVVELAEELVGFLTIRVLENQVADGRLYAVLPRARGRGIGQALLIEGLHWSKSHAMKAMMISTQITNTASQISWARVGFVPHESFYTFHKWFEKRPEDD